MFWELTVGVPGYSVFSDLYLQGGALIAVSPDEEAAEQMPSPRDVMSDKDGNAAKEDRWTQIKNAELARTQLGDRAIRLPGVTYIFNDKPGRGE